MNQCIHCKDDLCPDCQESLKKYIESSDDNLYYDEPGHCVPLENKTEVNNYPPLTVTTRGLHKDDGKIRVDLVSPEAIYAIAEVMTFGCKKYSPRNWEKGIKFTRIYASALRHMLEWIARRDKDPESGLNHLKHALWNIAALVTYIERGKEELDDRPEVNK